MIARSSTMSDQQFQVGECVRAQVSTGFVQAGTLGTVRAMYPVIPDAYEVKFDRQPKSWLMWDDELEHVAGQVQKPRRHIVAREVVDTTA
jgi:hypothetical protein